MENGLVLPDHSRSRKGMVTEKQNAQSGEMIFGFDRETDERSLALFMRRMADSELADVFIPRLEDAEINTILDLFTGMMKKHLHRDEYHRFFLGEKQK